MPNAGDMLVVAVHKGSVPKLDPRAFDNPKLRAELERFHIRNLDDLLLHRIGGRAALRPYFSAFRAPANSDFYPVLDTNAAAARFLYRPADEVPRLLESGIPLIDLFERPRAPQPDPGRLSPGQRPWLARSGYAIEARAAGAYLRSGRLADLDAIAPAAAGDLVLLRATLLDCSVRISGSTLRRVSTYLAWLVNQHLPHAERAALWRLVEASPCRTRLTDMERYWLRLHAAVAAEAAAEIVQTSGRILDADPNLPPELVAYALAAHMTGLLLAGRGQDAMGAIVKHGSRLRDASSWQPVFRFLVGHTRN
jgi:hypothetical protein